MEKLLFKVQEFQGPLDLILSLIAKHKMNIFDIQISELLRQYAQAIESMEQASLEVASEFLEMASRLVYIKTAMLLPKHEEEGQRLKRELQGRLLEYRLCKLVAQLLGERAQLLTRYVRSQMPIEIDETYTRIHEPGEIAAAYRDAVGRGKRRLPPPAQTFSALVSRRVVSVGSRIVFVLKKLYSAGQYDYESLFMESEDRSELVATFMAVLELVKARRVELDGKGNVILRRFQGMPERPPDDTDFASEFDRQAQEDSDAAAQALPDGGEQEC